MDKKFFDILEQAYKSCRLKSSETPRTGIILGSGLSDYMESIEGTKIPFSSISGFPSTSVKGHPGVLKISADTALMAGRIHIYEGHTIDTVVLPVFLLWKLGVKKLIVTNASGGINTILSPGDLVLINDHINLTGLNPLTGINNDEAGERFPDMSEAYSKKLIKKALEIRPEMKQGVYAGLKGPSYETPAEVRMLRTLGADMVGMSTVNEVIAAEYLGMDVLGISCITNMAAGILDKPLDHNEVIETGRKAGASFADLIQKLVKSINN